MSVSELPAPLARAIAARGYAELTPVQQAVLEAEAGGRDLLVSAQTGSGKTVAYGLAIAPDLLADGGETLAAAPAPLALVIAPTRELAQQVERELRWLYAEARGRVVSCVGGMDPRRESRALAAGAHIVVGTPGRLRDHLERGALKLGALRAVVLDEADEMLDLGFREELEAILEAAASDRRTLLFSATLPPPIIAMAERFQRPGALRISVAAGRSGHADIDYRAVTVAAGDVEHAVVNLLRFHDPGAAIVFCSTREAVRRLHANLVERGFSVVALSGELSQTERNHALQALRDRRARVCVATDVAARGIDIPNLDLVIHAEPPHDPEALQHRSGRTGRAGRKGMSVLIAPLPRRRRVEALLRLAKVQASWEAAPSADAVRERDQARLVEQLRPAGEPADEDLAVARALLAEADAEALVASLVQGRRAGLPAPEDLAATPEPGQPVRREARAGFEGSSWFAIALGRNRNAEARWLLPLICRRGGVTKSDIGAIRVFERETRFEIAAGVAERFRQAVLEGGDEGGRITPVDEPDLPPARDRKRPPPRAGKPRAQSSKRQMAKLRG
jgi:ATP-dependent RNA helicase DeaD